MRVKDEIAKLNEVDTYSLILFALYKLKEVPEYAALSELAYVLDKDNLLKLCEYFGGVTLRIPTIDELESIIYSLVLYQYVDIDNMPYDKAIEIIGHKTYDLRKVKTDYQKIKAVLKNYNFTSTNGS